MQLPTNIRRILYRLQHDFLNVNNIVILVAFLIAASFVWGSLTAMQNNYKLQRNVDFKQRQLEVASLQTENLQLQQQYYRTAEYQELALRESLGMALPGEHQLILPANSQAAIDADNTAPATAAPVPTTNIEQWVNFLFGGYSQSIGDE